jgi:hypothetical protein
LGRAQAGSVKHELVLLALWLAAVVPTLLLVQQSGVFTYLGPLYFFCIVGSLYVVRWARRDKQ